MITSRGRKRWIFPKGLADSARNLKSLATEKAFVEAGVEGRTSDSTIGTYQTTKKGASSLVHVFVIEVNRMLKTWEQDDREREWVSLETAKTRIENQQLERLLGSLPDFLTAAKLRQLLAALPVFNRSDP